MPKKNYSVANQFYHGSQSKGNTEKTIEVVKTKLNSKEKDLGKIIYLNANEIIGGYIYDRNEAPFYNRCNRS